MASGIMARRRTGIPGQTSPFGMGRPSLFSEAVTVEIEEGLKAGRTLTAICSAPHLPDINTVMEWRQRMAEFAGRLARARAAGADALVEDGLRRLKDATPGRDGTIAIQREVAGHMRWMAARMNPADWGDKQQVQVSGGVTVEHIAAPSWLEDVVGIAAPPGGGGSLGGGQGGRVVVDVEPMTSDQGDQDDDVERLTDDAGADRRGGQGDGDDVVAQPVGAVPGAEAEEGIDALPAAFVR